MQHFALPQKHRKKDRTKKFCFRGHLRPDPLRCVPVLPEYYQDPFRSVQELPLCLLLFLFPCHWNYQFHHQCLRQTLSAFPDKYCHPDVPYFPDFLSDPGLHYCQNFPLPEPFFRIPELLRFQTLHLSSSLRPLSSPFPPGEFHAALRKPDGQQKKRLCRPTMKAQSEYFPDNSEFPSVPAG